MLLKTDISTQYKQHKEYNKNKIVFMFRPCDFEGLAQFSLASCLLPPPLVRTRCVYGKRERYSTQHSIQYNTKKGETYTKKK